MITDTGYRREAEPTLAHPPAEAPLLPARAKAGTRVGQRQPRWQRRYVRAVISSDFLALIVSSYSYSFWGSATDQVVATIGAAVLVLAGVCLAVAGAWDASILGQDSFEFTRLLRGMLAAAVVIGMVSLALEQPAGRPWAFAVLPIAGILAALGRLLLRIDLRRRRSQGRAMARILAIGTEESVAELIGRARRAPHNGWSIVGVCTPTGAGPDGNTIVDGVPVLGDLDSAPVLAQSAHFDAVSVGQTPGWTPRRLQQLAWDLEGTNTELIVDPGLMEVAGPRLHMATVDGLPLLRLTHPTFSGAPQLLKGAFDKVAALALLTLLSPLLLALIVLIRRDGGPAFFRQKRVGLGGHEFHMIKFRTMVVDAEARLAELTAANEAAGPLFKMRNDPRITKIGAVLRKYSIDELPQLLNVLGGTMSLVGPRPPLPREVAGYARDARRRLLVKPGMTGLWQVSGRSDLSWEETVRLDLRYVENWSLALDAQILIRTIRAVIKGSGAY